MYQIMALTCDHMEGTILTLVSLIQLDLKTMMILIWHSLKKKFESIQRIKRFLSGLNKVEVRLSGGLLVLPIGRFDLIPRTRYLRSKEAMLGFFLYIYVPASKILFIKIRSPCIEFQERTMLSNLNKTTSIPVSESYHQIMRFIAIWISKYVTCWTLLNMKIYKSFK